MRPISPDSCIEGVKVDISDSYGVEIRSRDAVRFAVDDGRPANSAAPTLRPASAILYGNTSPGEHAAANTKMVGGHGEESDRPLLDSVSIFRPGETESGGRTSARDHAPGLMEVSSPPRPDAYGVSHTCAVGHVIAI